jgi:hypothetical protein
MKSPRASNVVVFDRYDYSFMMITLYGNQKVDVCARLLHPPLADLHQLRPLGRYDHVIVQTRPAKPSRIDDVTYTRLLDTVELCET